MRRGTNGNTKITYKAAAGEDKSKDEHSLQRGGRTSDSRDVGARCLWSPTVCRSQRNLSYHRIVRPPTLEPRGKQHVSIITPIVRTAVSESMAIAKGWVGDARITALRAIGCSGVIVNQQFVRHDQYTGNDGFIQLFDNCIKKVPIAVSMLTPLICQTQWKLCLQDAIYDVIIGNVPGAKSPHQADSDIHTAAVVKRAQAKLKERTTQLTVAEASRCSQCIKND